MANMNARSEYLLKKKPSAADFNRGPLEEAPGQSETTQHVSRGGSFPRKEPSRLLSQDRAGCAGGTARAAGRTLLYDRATVAERERYWWARRTERLLSN